MRDRDERIDSSQVDTDKPATSTRTAVITPLSPASSMGSLYGEAPKQ